jgi:hypothetical protein
MKPGVYYFKQDLRMIETAWLNPDDKTITVWTYHCLKTGKGILTHIPSKSFKKLFKFLGEV